jgi:mono/diheme cytochrome c family protein
MLDLQREAGRGILLSLGRPACCAILLSFFGASEGRASDKPLPPPAQGRVDFLRDVLPIFETRCVECHGPAKQRGKLRLDSLPGVRKGGASGEVVLAGQSAESLLIRHVVGSEDATRMPPKGETLTDQQVGILRRWIDLEAGRTPTAQSPSPRPNPLNWAFFPPKRSPVPVLPAAHRAWVRNPIDAFVLETLQAHGLRPSPEADRRTLIRRVSLDLTGLPPIPEEVDRFVGDPSSDAFERLVDRLLGSPRYGERWARHWLDVVHYADSHGQDQDRPRPNAWPYRDYLIRSFNDDKPYDRFVSEQVAGDVLSPDDPGAIAATGFLAAGPWDESGLMGISEDSLDRQIAHYLDRDDMVTTTMSTFAGLTVGCARCHDHKFDPITQDDYYALQAVFAGIDKAERTFDVDPKLARKRAELEQLLTQLRGWRQKAEPALLAPVRQAQAAAFEAEWRAVEKGWVVPEPLGWRSKQGSVLKPLLDRSVLSMGARPDKDAYIVTLGTDLVGMTGLRLEVLSDETLPMSGPGRADNGNLHLSEVRVRVRPKGSAEPGVLVPIKAAVADFDQAGWGIPRAVDGNPATAWGIHPAVGQSHQAVFAFDQAAGFAGGTEVAVELDQLHGGSHLIGRFRISLTTTSSPTAELPRILPAALRELMEVPEEWRSPAHKAELARSVWERRIDREFAELPPPSRVYCGTNRFTAEGSFRPARSPRPVHVLKRGDISQPGNPAVPGSVQSVPGLQGRFSESDASDEGQRRAGLARWLTDPANPLTYRVMANRVWHYHFGKGIVDTPNDFGKMGGTPSHPELLDWLAVEFRESGGSLKKLHRLIVTSSTYRQSSRHDPVAADLDADNRLLWRMNRVRLDAESVRDAVLLASGRLVETMYGPPVMHFLMTPGVHVTPVANYDEFDLDQPRARRRSVYRYVFRTRPDPLLESLDCPDASQSAPVRTGSVSALQALALWNNRFILRHAEHLAALASHHSPEIAVQVEFVSFRLLGRPPTDAELVEWGDFARRHDLSNLCRVLLNSSEFLFAD